MENKRLKSAMKCLEKVIKKQKKGEDISSSLFQFCKQMKVYLIEKEEFKEAKIMNKYAKAFKLITKS